MGNIMRYRPIPHGNTGTGKLVVTFLVAVLAGCTSNPQLHPAAGAKRLSGPAIGAVASAQGVQLEAAVQTWDGAPRDLKQVQPVLLTIHNRSERPLRVQYKAFQLVAADGTPYRALAPMAIDKSATVRVQDFSPYYATDFSGFRSAPYWGPYYGGFGGIYTGFGYDPFYYDTYDLRSIQLPTRDMLERALPEGVVDPGGSAKGYLYFEKLKHNPKEVQLQAELISARTGEQFGMVSIPFDVTY